jgi:2'-5' RNA ligase
MMRLFIATPTSENVEQELGRIISDLKNVGGPVKWVAPANIHLTIKFLGDTDESLKSQLIDIIDDVASKSKAAHFTINRLGGFPNLNRPRVIWAGLEGDKSQLGIIASQVDDEVHQLGWEKETREFRAHLTLGRVKRPQGITELANFIKSYKIETIPVEFDRLVLFKSTLTPRGPIYEILHEAILN